MKQTSKFKLNLVEASDSMSMKPLNENTEAIEQALSEVLNAVSARTLVASDRYTGTGTRSVTIQTPGFKPQAVLIRQEESKVDSNKDSYMRVLGGWCMWHGEDMAAVYEVYARSEESASGYEAGELRRENVEAMITFTAGSGFLTWRIPDMPSKYYDVYYEKGANVVNNKSGETYEWIAFGTAE